MDGRHQKKSKRGCGTYIFFFKYIFISFATIRLFFFFVERDGRCCVRNLMYYINNKNDRDTGLSVLRKQVSSEYQTSLFMYHRRLNSVVLRRLCEIDKWHLQQPVREVQVAFSICCRWRLAMYFTARYNTNDNDPLCTQEMMHVRQSSSIITYYNSSHARYIR